MLEISWRLRCARRMLKKIPKPMVRAGAEDDGHDDADEERNGTEGDSESIFLRKRGGG